MLEMHTHACSCTKTHTYKLPQDLSHLSLTIAVVTTIEITTFNQDKTELATSLPTDDINDKPYNKKKQAKSGVRTAE